jgi:ferric-dicitrate binding protein FerR (iron transport regulator)
MLEQDFEKLLAAYFEEELDEAGLARLRDAVRQVPARRRRFQRELRLHTLMRETAMVMLAQEQSKRTNLIAVGWQHWRRITALAACLAVCGFSALLVWNYWNQPELIGRCVRVADSDEIVLWRQGRQRTAGPNTVLRVGDRIQTGCAAQTVLRVDGAGLLTLQGMNTVELCSPTNAMAVSIERGHVLIEATKRGPGMPPLTIRTPQSSVQVLGTVFGLEVEPTATRLRVFEGEVTFEETSLGRVVRVSDGQYSVTGTPNLEALDQSSLPPDALLPGQRRIQPTKDTFLEAGRVVAGPYLKVEGGRRTIFLKFDVENVGRILNARLRLKQTTDPGSGTLRIWEGKPEDWSERTLSTASAPQAVREIGHRFGWVEKGMTVEVDVSSLIRREGTYTLIVTLDEPGGNDIWFGSKESPNPPELILTCQP